jgi:hypothetical protein
MASKVARFESSGLLPLGTSKTLVYGGSVDYKAALYHHTVDACQTIRNYPQHI